MDLCEPSKGNFSGESYDIDEKYVNDICTALINQNDIEINLENFAKFNQLILKHRNKITEYIENEIILSKTFDSIVLLSGDRRIFQVIRFCSNISYLSNYASNFFGSVNLIDCLLKEISNNNDIDVLTFSFKCIRNLLDKFPDNIKSNMDTDNIIKACCRFGDTVINDTDTKNDFHKDIIAIFIRLIVDYNNRTDINEVLILISKFLKNDSLDVIQNIPFFLILLIRTFYHFNDDILRNGLLEDLCMTLKSSVSYDLIPETYIAGTFEVLMTSIKCSGKMIYAEEIFKILGISFFDEILRNQELSYIHPHVFSFISFILRRRVPARLTEQIINMIKDLIGEIESITSFDENYETFRRMLGLFLICIDIDDDFCKTLIDCNFIERFYNFNSGEDETKNIYLNIIYRLLKFSERTDELGELTEELGNLGFFESLNEINECEYFSYFESLCAGRTTF